MFATGLHELHGETESTHSDTFVDINIVATWKHLVELNVEHFENCETPEVGNRIMLQCVPF